MELPEAFEKKMKVLLGDEYDAYIKSYDMPRYQGIRINTLKVDLEKWGDINPFKDVKKVPWCNEGFYYSLQERPAKHPYYFAGLYYIQEPSAMAPGSYLPIDSGDRVLDLCAAPGGKSTQIAAKLSGTGVLIANDISNSRAKGLLKNIENFGAGNVIVTNESPERLAKKCQGFFDKIIIDAPCSGEGMFRKSEEAIKNWNAYGPQHCCSLQRSILNHAASMLRDQGMILYSTCTFSPEENEGMIDEFLKDHSDFHIIPLQPAYGIKEAKPEWVDADPQISGALRLWPQHIEGEGHFVCLMQKVASQQQEDYSRQKYKKSIRDYKEAAEFIQEYTYIPLDEKVQEIGGKLYLAIDDAPDLSGLRIIRSGLLIGEIKNKRFEPHHALVLAYSREMFKRVISFKESDEQVTRYLKGETLLYEAAKGYHVICIGDYPLGWIKAQNGFLKNQYPPSWRMMG